MKSHYYPIPSVEDELLHEVPMTNSDNKEIQWIVYPIRFVLMLMITVSLFLMSYAYFNSEPVLLLSNNENPSVHIKLSDNGFLATQSNGDLITTKVAWIHGGRFELIKTSGAGGYHIKSLITKQLVQVNTKTMKLQAVSSSNNLGIWNLFSSSSSFIPFTLQINEQRSLRMEETLHQSDANTYYVTSHNIQVDTTDQSIRAFVPSKTETSSTSTSSSSNSETNRVSIVPMSKRVKGVNIGEYISHQHHVYSL